MRLCCCSTTTSTERTVDKVLCEAVVGGGVGCYVVAGCAAPCGRRTCHVWHSAQPALKAFVFLLFLLSPFATLLAWFNQDCLVGSRRGSQSVSVHCGGHVDLPLGVLLAAVLPVFAWLCTPEYGLLLQQSLLFSGSCTSLQPLLLLYYVLLLSCITVVSLQVADQWPSP